MICASKPESNKVCFNTVIEGDGKYGLAGGSQHNVILAFFININQNLSFKLKIQTCFVVLCDECLFTSSIIHFLIFIYRILPVF